MLALAARPTLLASRQAAAPQHRRRAVGVRAQADPSPAAAPAAAAAADDCPLLCGAVQGKTSCVHPGRPVSSACPDCPRKARMAMMAKTK